MADNLSITPGTGAKAATDEVTYSGDTAMVQLVRLVDVTGAEGSKTVTSYTMPVTGTFWQATQPISAVSLPLPTGAALDTTLQSILTKLGTARTETLWTDDTGSYFVRVDNAGTISWTDTSGTASSAPGTGSRPAAGATILLDKSSYQATAGGTGYSTGDLLDHLVTTDPATGAVIGHFWLNTTTEAKLASAPSSANISPLSPLPTGAATAANQTTANTSLATIAAAAADTTTPSPVKIDQTTDGTTNRVNAVPGSTAHALIPAPSTYRLLSAAASTNGANIKASAGTVKGIQGYNAKATAVYLKLYNKASSPTVGTDTPVKTIYLPATAAFAFDFGTGVAFATGISIALTGAGADADTTALTAADVLALNVDYH